MIKNWENIRKIVIRNGAWCSIPDNECSTKELLDQNLIYIVGKQNVERYTKALIDEIILTIEQGSYYKNFDKKSPLKPNEVIELIKNKFYD